MYYHSPQFQNIADQAAAFARPLIIAKIQELAPDFIKQFPAFTRVDCSTGRILWYYGTASFQTQKKAHQHPFLKFLRDIVQKDLIGFCPDVTLQPALLIDGVPAEEAKNRAQYEFFATFTPF